MFVSRSNEETLTKDVSYASSDNTKMDATRILESLLNCDPEDEEDLAFIQVFQKLASIGGIDDIIIMSVEDLRTLHVHLDRKTNKISHCRITRIELLQFFLNRMQQRKD